MKILILVLFVVIVVQFAMISDLKIDLKKILYSRNLWKHHAMATANWRIDHYTSDYSYLTKGVIKR